MKPCPIQPCPELISKRWAMCKFHWTLVPPLLRRANKDASRRRDVGSMAYTTILAMCWLWQWHELVSLPANPDHRGRDYPWQGCTCRSCSAILAKAQKVTDVSSEFFYHLAAKFERMQRET